MEIVSLAGPALQPIPERVGAQWCRDLRGLGGGEPCEDGLERALDFIGDRHDVALANLLNAITCSDRTWAELACGTSGYGDGDGDGYGFGSGSGSGHGSGFGYGFGYGYGYGFGSGSGSGAS